ncbi:hypothetical protein EYC59_03755 [Candidatus Saccharibacteria bacterium]|nr:MAG: hypothetical protein EYC59_03755 [Candidatus Saccharibacteria bacterium]
MTGPSITGITGTHSTFAVRSVNPGTSNSLAVSCAWTTPSTEDYDALTQGDGSTDGIELSIAYDDNVSGATFTPSSNMTCNVGASSEAISFLLDPVAPPSGIAAPWITA